MYYIPFCPKFSASKLMIHCLSDSSIDLINWINQNSRKNEFQKNTKRTTTPPCS